MGQGPQDDGEERVTVKLMLRRSTFEVLASIARQGDAPVATYIKQELERLVSRIGEGQVVT